MIEPRERLAFDLSLLLEGSSGLHEVLEWVAVAPHVDAELVLDADEVVVLGAISPRHWTDVDELARKHPRGALDALLAKRLLVAEHDAAAAGDQALRDAHWRAASAVMHYGSRWRAVDAAERERRYAER
ncbi:MAG TPA: putative peptide maturation dehydrogenase, partial [Dokdonella sp.]